MIASQIPRTMELCRQAVINRGLALPQPLRQEISKAGRRLGVTLLHDDEIAALLRDASQHNPHTGRVIDPDGALALREEMCARHLFRSS